MPGAQETEFERGLRALIKEAEAIDRDTNPYGAFGGDHEDVLHKRYIKWMEYNKTVFSHDDLIALLPHDFFFTENIELPRLPLGAFERVGDTKRQNELRKFRGLLHILLEKQIRGLNEVLKRYRLRDQVLVIHIEKDGLVWREDRSQFSYTSTRSGSKRVKLLKMLSVHPTGIDTETLSKKVGYGTRSILAQEKRRLNKTLREKLGLSQDVILGGKERRLRGYTINPAFKIDVTR